MTKLVIPKGPLSPRNERLRLDAVARGWEIEYLEPGIQGYDIGEVHIDECVKFTEENWERMKSMLSAEPKAENK